MMITIRYLILISFVFLSLHSCCKPNIVQFDNIKQVDESLIIRNFFLIECHPKMQDSLIKLIDGFNINNPIPDQFIKGRDYSRIFFKKTKKTFKTYSENDDYFNNDRLNQHQDDILVEVLWGLDYRENIIMTYFFYDGREPISKIWKNAGIR